MSIESYIARRAKNDVAVYWASPVSDGFGKFTYSTPVEINCIWLEMIKVLKSTDNEEIISTAVIYVVEDLVMHGMLFHGCLKDLTTAQKSDPSIVKTAQEIIRTEKNPSLQIPGKFGRQVYV